MGRWKTNIMAGDELAMRRRTSDACKGTRTLTRGTYPTTPAPPATTVPYNTTPPLNLRVHPSYPPATSTALLQHFCAHTAVHLHSISIVVASGIFSSWYVVWAVDDVRAGAIA